MHYFNIKNFGYILFSILSLIYIILLFKIIGMQYQALNSITGTSIYDSITQYNWKYWFEDSSSYQTPFAILLQSIDVNFLQGKGIFPIVINISFISTVRRVVL